MTAPLLLDDSARARRDDAALNYQRGTALADMLDPGHVAYCRRFARTSSAAPEGMTGANREALDSDAPV